MKSFFPTICPACNKPLTIEVGEKSETLKLMCNNKECSGTLLKRLQRGIIALEIRGLGPKIIENLMNAGIESSIDLFDPEKFNSIKLISSGYFRKGRALTKILKAVNDTKSLPIKNAILSLQYEDIGKTFSEKIGMKISGVYVDFAGLQYSIREQLDDEGSELNKNLKTSIEKFEEFGVEIIRFETPKEVIATKKITKIVDISGFEDRREALETIKKLGWNYTEGFMKLAENCQLLIVPEKNTESIRVKEAKESGTKIMTLKQVKLIFL